METYRGQELREDEQERIRDRGRGRDRAEIREDIAEVLAGVRLVRTGFENLITGNRRDGVRQVRRGLDEIEDGLQDTLEDL